MREQAVYSRMLSSLSYKKIKAAPRTMPASAFGR
jgi:hypothetical protein